MRIGDVYAMYTMVAKGLSNEDIIRHPRYRGYAKDNVLKRAIRAREELTIPVQRTSSRKTRSKQKVDEAI